MRSGDVKARLEAAARMDRELGALAERQRRYRELARGRNAPGMEALEKEIGERIEAYAATVREVEGEIDRLEEPLQREVLRYRYLNGWNWRAIAARMGYSREWLWKQHARALERMENVNNL